MRPVSSKIQRVSHRIGVLLLPLAVLGSAWMLASWAEQARGLSFGPVFTVVTLLEVVLVLGAVLGAAAEEEVQATPRKAAEQKSAA